MLHDDKPSLNELTHFGVKGMKWGVRRQKRKEVRAARVKEISRQRDKAARRIIKEGYELDFIVRQAQQGQRATARILDIMRKNPKKTYLEAVHRQIGERVVKSTLVLIGASVIGTALARTTQR